MPKCCLIRLIKSLSSFVAILTNLTPCYPISSMVGQKTTIGSYFFKKIVNRIKALKIKFLALDLEYYIV